MDETLLEKVVYFSMIVAWYQFLRLLSGAFAYHLTINTVYFKERVGVARKICIILIVLTVLVVTIVMMPET